MNNLTRRSFLGASFAGLAASQLLGADGVTEVLPLPREKFDFQPATLFLTWQKDPTTTMTIQWVGPETTLDTSIQFAPRSTDAIWQVAKTTTKPFPNTDLKVHRCELTGLVAGAEYSFLIGKSSPLY